MSAFKVERDTIAGLGLLTSHYVRFDPGIPVKGKSIHPFGFNVHCLVVDNVDGEVLAINRNRIYVDHNPLQHAEQVAVRDAIQRIHAKYPRPAEMSVDEYIRSKMFMAPGSSESDYLNTGCTLYNTFDPCGYCAVTLLVCYMKRIAYLFDDKKFDGVYEKMREYFRNRESVKEPIALKPGTGNPIADGARLIEDLRSTVKALEESGTPLVMTLDNQVTALQKAATIFASIRPEHLETVNGERDRNLKTLLDVKRLCNLN